MKQMGSILSVSWTKHGAVFSLNKPRGLFERGVHFRENTIIDIFRQYEKGLYRQRRVDRGSIHRKDNW